ncbi:MULTISPECIES: pyridoxamine 5'-phosphate oxidase [unclassified Pseudofrankia]|uniref:pyridoxamine 5'-phosphate oxidase n=1 Tax=unclassified Pseudofrankia TaxID=2994372 RepID=UPI0009F25DA4|nr:MULTISPECIES: pyridoxamine 5'-phosphate oxidase [unclassified Pseudofrankia]MDT3444997.1 pyridoxamine 5'-phosphate oxidase [Pseudofrankia sp. BMG5.37]
MAAPEPASTRPRPIQPTTHQPRPGQAPPGHPHPARVPAETDTQLGADLAAVRRGYGGGRLEEGDLAPTWMEQFARWFADAAAAGSGIVEPNAMVFGTADAAGRPSARTVLLKGFGAEGFLLFTNYTSRKGTESAANPHGSLVFPWYALERQVIVVGTVERVSAQRSAEYFHSRPRGSQLGAWASHQSAVLSSRAELERRDAELVERWPPGTPIPVPPFWGGLLVVPETVEFWQGRPDRLHDRLRYRRADDTWLVERLAP